ncbi:helix-turn-helix domain-containing protein [Pseudarthrobacter albicanus]|uniref:helix-turn-helix domain-containing protein n=1 Tax=Pseudarthrobacter albicanus TaxID=2823873 RepID=UPI001FE2D3DB|nr:helix-turn-helix domain-containing protein [Pseudarthrobacter albicanus]
MALIAPRVTAGLPAEDAQKLQYALSGSHDITVFVDGTVHRLPPEARDAVVDLLNRFSRGEAVTVSSVEEMLTTSRAAELAGISHTYLRNMTDRGEIPVEYRGTHRRIRLADIMAWLETQKKNAPAEGVGDSATAGAGAGATASAATGGNDSGTDGS